MLERLRSSLWVTCTVRKVYVRDRNRFLLRDKKSWSITVVRLLLFLPNRFNVFTPSVTVEDLEEEDSPAVDDLMNYPPRDTKVSVANGDDADVDDGKQDEENKECIEFEC